MCWAYMVAECIIFLICYIINYMWIRLTFSDLEVKKDTPQLAFLWQSYINFPLFPDNYLNSWMHLWMWLQWSHLAFHLLLSLFRELISNKNNTWLQVIYFSFSKTFNSSTFISIMVLQNRFIYSPINSKCLCTISSS